jgi:cytochrome c2
MQKTIIATFLLLAFALNAQGVVKTIGKGETLNFDPAAIPAHLKSNYAVLQTKCVKCHTLERTVVAVRSGIAPISGGVFDRNAVKRYGIKMLRKADSNMTKDDVKVVTELLNTLLDEPGK